MKRVQRPQEFMGYIHILKGGNKMKGQKEFQVMNLNRNRVISLKVVAT